MYFFYFNNNNLKISTLIHLHLSPLYPSNCLHSFSLPFPLNVHDVADSMSVNAGTHVHTIRYSIMW